jgi:Zn-finger nucleic acid-binding protein
MLCPNDKSAMRQVKVEAHYGQTVILDQCSVCGGIWFDTSELYMANQGQAEHIELLDSTLLQTLTALKNEERLCPRDQSRLIRFSDPFFPADLIIERCTLCGGLWLNRGEFSKYQKFRQSKLDKKNQETIIIDQPACDKVETLGRLGQFLSTPLDTTTWRPLAPDKLSDKENTALNMVLNVVSLLLRYFIRF